MKKILYLLFTITLLTSCSSQRETCPYNIHDLRVGMTKYQVERLVGPGERILQVVWTPYGYEEILQYRNCYNQLFALEYLEGVLIAADYIYQGTWYPMHQIRPLPGRPVFPPSYKPNRPTPPPPSNRPPSSRPPANNGSTLPPASSRPPANTSGNDTPSSSRPTNTGNSNRTQNSNPATSRPSTTTTQNNTDSDSSRQGSSRNNSSSSSSPQTPRENNASGSSRR